MKICELSKEQQTLVFSKLALDESNYTKHAQTDVVKLGHVIDAVDGKIEQPDFDVDQFIKDTDSDDLFKLFTELAVKKSTWNTFIKQNVNLLDAVSVILENAEIEMNQVMSKNYINKLMQNFIISLTNENYLTIKVNKDLAYEVFDVHLAKDIDIEKQLEELNDKEVEQIKDLAQNDDIEESIKIINDSIYMFKLRN